MIARASWVVCLSFASCSESEPAPSALVSGSASAPVAVASSALGAVGDEIVTETSAVPGGEGAALAPSSSAAAPARSVGPSLVWGSVGPAPSPAPSSSGPVPEPIAKCCASLRQTPPSVPPKHASTFAALAKLCEDAKTRGADEKRFLHHVERTLPPELRRAYPACAPRPLR